MYKLCNFLIILFKKNFSATVLRILLENVVKKSSHPAVINVLMKEYAT